MKLFSTASSAIRLVQIDHFVRRVDDLAAFGGFLGPEPVNPPPPPRWVSTSSAPDDTQQPPSPPPVAGPAYPTPPSPTFPAYHHPRFTNALQQWNHQHPTMETHAPTPRQQYDAFVYEQLRESLQTAALRAQAAAPNVKYYNVTPLFLTRANGMSNP